MRKIQRLAAVGAMAALTVALAACGSSETPSAGSGATSAPAGSAPTSAAAATGAATNGVTTASDVFGPACKMLPQGSAAGGLEAMGPQPVATAASTNPLLKTLTAAVGAANLGDTLNQQSAITVYAPYDGAFQAVKTAMGDTAFNALLADPTKLGALLEYHVVGTRYDATSLLAAGKTTELKGGDVTIGGSVAAGVTVTDGMGGVAKVLCGNIPTSNATVFVIDKVLQPKAS